MDYYLMFGFWHFGHRLFNLWFRFTVRVKVWVTVLFFFQVFGFRVQDLRFSINGLVNNIQFLYLGLGIQGFWQVSVRVCVNVQVVFKVLGFGVKDLSFNNYDFVFKLRFLYFGLQFQGYGYGSCQGRGQGKGLVFFRLQVLGFRMFCFKYMVQ